MNRKERISKLDRILGIKERNISYIFPNNLHKDFPFASDKVLTKQMLSEVGIPVPPTYLIVDRMGEINNVGPQVNRLEAFAIKPAKDRGGGGILVVQKT